MVEEIKLLLPLLQQATTGTIWLVVAMFAKDIFLAVFFGLLVFFAGRYVVRTLSNGTDVTRILRAMIQKEFPTGSHHYITNEEIIVIEKRLREKQLIN